MNPSSQKALTSPRPVPAFRRRLASPDRILAAALDAFEQSGFARTRLEDIGTRIGVTKAAIYLHFASKRALFEQLVAAYCLPAMCLDSEISADSISNQLRLGDAARVLRMVVAEWSLMPELGALYVSALRTRIDSWPAAPSSAKTDQMVQAALSERCYELLFKQPET